MKQDPLRDKIFYIISQSNEPITINGIYLALRDKTITKNQIAFRLAQLRVAGLIEKGEAQIGDRKFNIFRKKVD